MESLITMYDTILLYSDGCKLQLYPKIALHLHAMNLTLKSMSKTNKTRIW